MKGFVCKWHIIILMICLLATLVTVPTTTFAKSAARSLPSLKIARLTSVCPAAGSSQVRCFAIRADLITPLLGAPAGYNPSDLQSAYNLTSAITSGKGVGQTVAIVDAFDDPKAESDLAVYRSQFGLPPCTTTNGCFRKVNQSGGKKYPRGNVGWAEEISLDLDMVSAICPNCHILLVEANNNSSKNLGLAVNEAVALKANEVSNSYGGPESRGETSLATYYDHPGHVITASSGDSGYGTAIPAAFNTITSVGGTTLQPANNARGWSETVWDGTGSGCSDFISKPSWQDDLDCPNRTMNDVSADADPHTGVSVYDSYRQPGWLVFGGTSVSSPIIASVYALSGNADSINDGSYPYSHGNSTNLYDVTMGSNGSCGDSYLCTAEVGYDGPTGLGTPNGTDAF